MLILVMLAASDTFPAIAQKPDDSVLVSINGIRIPEYAQYIAHWRLFQSSVFFTEDHTR
jgi:hypothetical protein